MRFQSIRSCSAKRSTRLDQSFAEAGKKLGERDEAGIFWPGSAVHTDKELATAAKRNTQKLDFEVCIATIILDRNSQICFHKLMITCAFTKTSRARRHARPLAE